MKKLYSPTQIGVSAFFGGPIAIVYLLKQNFKTLGDINNEKATIFFGAIFVAILMCLIPFLPDNFPNKIIPTTYTIITVGITSKYQMKKADIAESDDYDFQSSWKVLIISILSILAFLALVIMVGLSLEKLGYISLDE